MKKFGKTSASVRLFSTYRGARVSGVARIASAAQLQAAFMDIIFVAEIQSDAVAEAFLQRQAAAQCPKGRQALIARKIVERDLVALERPARMRRIGLVEHEIWRV